MDSGNSSSMQSSSGGGGGGDQEEYESRTDQSFSAFFNQTNNTTPTVSSNMAGSTQLDSLIANYFNNTGWSSPDQTPLWSATKPPDGSCPIPPPQPQPQEPVFFTNPLDHSQQNMRGVVVSNTSTSPSCSVPTDKKNGLMPTRNPKKRSRVSRRAPTTVLTTDTSNFRAMVQEFTGNPSTPFNGLSSSSPFPTRSRFDLFGSSSSSSSLPLRPFPHKLINHHQHLPPPPSSSDNYHLLNINTQNITNPFLNNNQSQTSRPLFDQSSLSLRRSNDFGRVETNFEGLQNIMGSPRTTTTQPTTLDTIHGDKTHENVDHHNDMLMRSINGEDRATLQRSDGSGSVVRNEGMVELSWISSSD